MLQGCVGQSGCRSLCSGGAVPRTRFSALMRLTQSHVLSGSISSSCSRLTLRARGTDPRIGGRHNQNVSRYDKNPSDARGECRGSSRPWGKGEADEMVPLDAGRRALIATQTTRAGAPWSDASGNHQRRS
jgi:hypothetical protein